MSNTTTINKLQSLTNQYNSILTQYQNTYEQYIALLKTLISSGEEPNTFESSPQVQQYQQQLLSLNSQLIEINDQINVITNQDYNTDVKDNIASHKILKTNFNNLLDERKKIDNILNYYGDLQQEVEISDAYTTEAYTRYIILIGITIVLFFLLFKYAILSNQQTGGGGSSNNNRIKLDIIFLLCVMIVFLGLANIFKNVNLLTFLTIIIVVYIFIKIKISKN